MQAFELSDIEQNRKNLALESLIQRPRRLRNSPILRKMVRETRVTIDDLIYPMFVTEGEAAPIQSMPGISRFDIADLCWEVEAGATLGSPGIILFVIPAA